MANAFFDMGFWLNAKTRGGLDGGGQADMEMARMDLIFCKSSSAPVILAITVGKSRLLK